VCLTATNENACSTTTCKQVSVATSITSEQSGQFIVYPNPAAERLTIETGIQGESLVRLFNLTGQQVAIWNVSGEKVEIPLDQISSGSYILELTNLNGLFHTSLEVR